MHSLNRWLGEGTPAALVFGMQHSIFLGNVAYGRLYAGGGAGGTEAGPGGGGVVRYHVHLGESEERSGTWMRGLATLIRIFYQII